MNAHAVTARVSTGVPTVTARCAPKTSSIQGRWTLTGFRLHEKLYGFRTWRCPAIGGQIEAYLPDYAGVLREIHSDSGAIDPKALAFGVLIGRVHRASSPPTRILRTGPSVFRIDRPARRERTRRAYLRIDQPGGWIHSLLDRPPASLFTLRNGGNPGNRLLAPRSHPRKCPDHRSWRTKTPLGRGLRSTKVVTDYPRSGPDPIGPDAVTIVGQGVEVTTEAWAAYFRDWSAVLTILYIAAILSCFVCNDAISEWNNGPRSSSMGGRVGLTPSFLLGAIRWLYLVGNGMRVSPTVHRTGRFVGIDDAGLTDYTETTCASRFPNCARSLYQPIASLTRRPSGVL